jgi:ATP-dependent RNA helicase RhlE
MAYYAYRSIKKPMGAGRPARGRSNNQSSNRRRMGQYIDPSRFVKTARAAEDEVYESQHTFDDFAIHEALKANLAAKGYVTPSPIQDQTIPMALTGKDIIGIASTGTGKTAAFAIPILQRLTSEPGSAALIIAPTRELAEQIEQECRSLGKGSGLFGTLLIGGTGMGTQLRDLTLSPRIVVGTPGRIKDHLERGTLKLQNFNTVVLDEVDRMLDMGFVDDVTTILSRLHTQRQSFFFSATFDNKVSNLIKNFTEDPFTVSIKASSSSDSVHQDVVRYNGNIDKMDKLHTVLSSDDGAKVIIFDETRRNVERLTDELAARGFKVDALHGGKSQGQRQRALSRFKKNEVRILIATDVAARGIDIVDITHVINYSIPNGYDDYVHRIGRTGRAGKIGFALTFIAD